MHLGQYGKPLLVSMRIFLLSSHLTNITFEGSVGWVTQLVVDMRVRRRRIATQLLQTLKTDELFANVTAMGLASSHPASCTALATCASKSCVLIIVVFSLAR